MTDKNDIFSGDNPFQIFKRWLHDASKTEINDHDAIALSTVDVDGLPNVRMVLLRGIEDFLLLFFTLIMEVSNLKKYQLIIWLLLYGIQNL